MKTLSDRISLFNEPLLPAMVQHKYEAMAKNVFTFYRGTCHLFYEDLHEARQLTSAPASWLCGDLHLENFGSYLGENKLVYFDINDFDEGILAPVSFDLSRMVTSIFIAFESLRIDQQQALKLAELFLRTYAGTLEKGKAVSIEPRTAKGMVCRFLKAAEKSKARDLLVKRTTRKKKKLVLSLNDERHFKVEKQLKKELKEHIAEWIKESSDGPYNYMVKGCVFRLAGTGSIGVKRYLFLLKSTNTPGKYLLIDMKQSMKSSLATYNARPQPSWTTEAERIISIQQRLQHTTPSLLSTTKFKEENYVIQELQPVKDSIKFKMISDHYRDLYQVINDMAVLTASTQLRSGGIQGSATIDELSAFGKDSSWQQPLLQLSEHYALQVKAYHRDFVKEYRSGTFSPAETVK